jgi:hypothetical protein
MSSDRGADIDAAGSLGRAASKGARCVDVRASQ